MSMEYETVEVIFDTKDMVDRFISGMQRYVPLKSNELFQTYISAIYELMSSMVDEDFHTYIGIVRNSGSETRLIGCENITDTYILAGIKEVYIELANMLWFTLYEYGMFNYGAEIVPMTIEPTYLRLGVHRAV